MGTAVIDASFWFNTILKDHLEECVSSLSLSLSLSLGLSLSLSLSLSEDVVHYTDC